MKTIKLLILTIMLSLVYSCDNHRDWAGHVKRFQAVNYGNKTYGTGFNMRVGDKVFTITNRHVCEVSEMLGHKEYAIVNGEKLKILKMSDKYDLCALESTSLMGLSLALFDSNPMDKIVLIGHPRGLDIVIREGRIITEDEEVITNGRNGIAKYKADRISSTAYPGNSGSPVLNAEGGVVGVLFAGASLYPHEPLIMPYEALKEFTESL